MTLKFYRGANKIVVNGEYEDAPGAKRIVGVTGWTHNLGFHVCVSAGQAARIKKLIADGYHLDRGDIKAIYETTRKDRCPCYQCFGGHLIYGSNN